VTAKATSGIAKIADSRLLRWLDFADVIVLLPFVVTHMTR
jgi:hypothetical protein